VTDLDKLVAEFRQEFEDGAQPDPGKFLARAAAEERPALANAIDAYLDTAPTRRWDPGAYERSPTRVAVDRYFESLEGVSGAWPELLPELRKRAKLARTELTARLAAALGFPEEAERVHAYYHQMEHGQLAASRVSDLVLDRLADIVGTSRERLRSAGESLSDPHAGQTAVRFARQAFPDPQFAADADSAADADAPSSPGTASPGERSTSRRDELDRLFLGDD
jgi:hypothetical protein